jgi:Glycosyl hydrolases family 16
MSRALARQSVPLGREPTDPDVDFAPPGYVLVFEEDFSDFDATPSGYRADGQPCWRTVESGGPLAYVAPRFGIEPFADIMQVTGGRLVLKLRTTTSAERTAVGTTAEYVGARFVGDTLLIRPEGYWAARARCAPAAGSWSAFWLYSWLGGGGVPYHEVDIYECMPGLFPNGQTVNYHHDGTGQANEFFNYRLDATTKMNVYGLLWNATGMELRVNGVPMWRRRFATAHGMPTIFDVVARAEGLNPATLPSTHEIAWFRYYRPSGGTRTLPLLDHTGAPITDHLGGTIDLSN